MLIEKVGSIEIFRPRPRTKLFACATGYRPRELHPGDCGITTFCRFFPAYLIAGPYVFYAEQFS
ncbi:MAG: hypothetical protein M3071_18585, partial [Actinomycetota bacterium]|nr:hypothetical protein [Actinomycetota bacterium]